MQQNMCTLHTYSPIVEILENENTIFLGGKFPLFLSQKKGPSNMVKGLLFFRIKKSHQIPKKKAINCQKNLTYFDSFLAFFFISNH
jgi:hypothetical protein